MTRNLAVACACAGLIALAAAAWQLIGTGQMPLRTQTVLGHQYVAASTQNLTDCVSTTIKLTGLDKPAFADYSRIWSLCGNQLYDVDYLVDFDIRREKFIRQELDERVILWMVVAITMSGVGLAGLQLSASYRLALIGRGQLADANEFSAEQGKLSVRSSVTGLLILIVSLLFFIVYVKFIYASNEVKEETPSNLRAVVLPILDNSGGQKGKTGLILPAGGAVIPPNAKPAPRAPAPAVR